MQILKDLYQKQSELVQTLDWQGQRREIEQLRDLSALALKTMGRVNESFRMNHETVFNEAQIIIAAERELEVR
jgi:hypothetical protein